MIERSPLAFFLLGLVAGVALLGLGLGLVFPVDDGHADALERERVAYEHGRAAERCHEYCSGELAWMWLREPGLEHLAGVTLASSPGADEVVCACFIAESVEIMRLEPAGGTTSP